MTVSELLDNLDDVLERAFTLPLSGGKCFVDSESIKAITDDIRINMPVEIKQAKAIVADRADIISDAKREADSIIRSAEERARAMVAQEEIVRQAQIKANDIIADAQKKAREMRAAGSDYVDEIMKRTENTLTANMDALNADLTKVRETRKTLRNPARTTANSSGGDDEVITF